MLDEVVVVGFGTQKKVNLTGSIGIATSKDLEARPVQNAVQALQGVVPGLNISNSGNGGELNASKKINIRGIGTIGDGSSGSPLILIDRMEGDLTQLNSQDIENISVLKDAAASSIYGSRAPFGVILVTTKSGQEGRATINYNNNFRFQTPVKLPNMQNSWEYVNFYRDAFMNDGVNNTYNNASYLQKVKDYYEGKLDPSDVVWSQDGTGLGSGGKWNYDYTNGNVNWLEEYYKSMSPSQEHNVSVSGGSKAVKYYASANYMTQDGFMRHGTDTYDRFTLTAKFSAEITKYLEAGFSTRFVRTDYDRPTMMNDGFYDNVLRRARSFRPIYDPNGYLMTDINYVNSLANGGRHVEQKDLQSYQINLKFKPIKELVINAEMNIRTNNDDTRWQQITQVAHYSGLGSQSADETYLSTLTGFSESYIYNKADKVTYLNPNIYGVFSKSFDKHNLGATLGFQSEQIRQRWVSAGRAGLYSDDLPQIGLSGSADKYEMGGAYETFRTAGFFGRVNYDYQGRYLVEANLRYDGASNFRSDSRWVWSPSFSAGWNIAEEAFMQDIDFINFLKLRASYGTLANQNTYRNGSPYYYPTYETMNVQSSNGSWLINGQKPNIASMPGLISQSLTWEKINSSNFGLDWALFKNRLSGSFDYYIRDTKDMVGPGIDLPSILGTAVPKTNNTELRTQGWEISVSWRDQIKDFSYGAKVSLSDEKTIIEKYYNATGDLGQAYYSGKEYGTVWGYTTKGIAKTQEEMDAHLATLPHGGQTALGSKWGAGDIMYEDLDGDGKISNGSNTLNDPGDLSIIANTAPRYFLGINLNAEWKGFDFQMFWQGVLKRDYSPGTRNMVFWGVSGSGEWWSTGFTDHLDYFRAENSESNLGINLDSYYPRPLFSDKNQQHQTKYVQDASYMRLKNLQLGYTLPNSLLNKVALKNLRIFVSGENLLTITSLSDVMDPETAGIGRQGGTVYPLSKTYSFGLSVNF